MNHAELKNYAQQARRDFIQAVTDRAAFYGVTAAGSKPATVNGDVAIIAGHASPASVVPKRKKLEDRIKELGFDQTMEALAYTWFNRFVAIRFMELHGYLEHGYRVLSHPDPTKTIPEILELAEHVDLPGLNREKVIDLKLAGNKEPVLYRMLLLAQCHALNSAMPFLFEGIDDETELVLPENLLHSDSIIRKLVAASVPGDWQEVEVIGWLYQYYISERKDEVMARKSAVPKEDIPAVTQLFTPHWIVRDLVENSLGRLWLLNRPGSRLREHMPYYIEGESETDFLRITNPEEIRFLDPACGSGHMLTYAFDLLFFIYTEEGYIPDEIPALILRHNLYGLEICPRATQLASLALVFKACEKSRQFLRAENLVRPNVMELREIRFSQNELRNYIQALDLGELFDDSVQLLMHQFDEAKNSGSLIQPCLDGETIAFIQGIIESKELGTNLFLRETHLKVERLLQQAEALSQRYQVVVANPPYMGGVLNSAFAKFVQHAFPDTTNDLSAAFIVRGIQLTVANGIAALVTMHSWMFVSTLQEVRRSVLRERQIVNLVHHGIGAFPSLNSKVVQTAAFAIQNSRPNTPPVFIDIREANPANKEAAFLLKQSVFRHLTQEQLLDLPIASMAYWLTPRQAEVFAECDALSEISKPRAGISTGNNDLFIRYWFEPSAGRVNFAAQTLPADCHQPFYPHNKAGGYRKWYGYTSFVLRYDSSALSQMQKCPGFRHDNSSFYLKASVSWGKVTSGQFSARYYPPGFTFDGAGLAIFPDDPFPFLGLLNSVVFRELIAALSQTLNFTVGDIGRFPLETLDASFGTQAECAYNIAHTDWDNSEISWGFRDQPLLRECLKGTTLESSWRNWEARCQTAVCQMKGIETENNRLFIEAYGLRDELSPEVSEKEIALARADTRRDTAAFLSYAVGCMMGRYSVDRPGLVLADAGDSIREFLDKVHLTQDTLTFVPSEDGIIPVLDGEWFQDDVVARTREFLRITFDEATLETNVHFIEESVGKDLRKYFLTDFYKDHLQTYKKRPIYWLFSSGKERAFQALVYLHRYRESTLSRMRTEYVIPLQGKIASRIDQLAGDIQNAGSTSHRKKLEKERDTLLKQRTELQAFDEKLRHLADQRIQLDLDDGVKVNYSRFGDLLAEVKAVTGGSDE